MKRINVLVIPTNYCNMRCVYCFHNEHSCNDECMTYETLERFIMCTQHSYTEINYIWHGGEPLSMGQKFYEKALDFQQKYSKKNQKITNAIQTNLTLLTDDFAKFLIKNNFSFGSSFDGIVNEKTRGMSKKILAGRDLLIKNGASCGFIQVITNINVTKMIENYNFFKGRNISFSINLYVEDTTRNDKLKLDINDYLSNIYKLYDLWVYDKQCTIRITQFQEIISFILFSNKSTCQYCSCLGHWISIRPNGDLYPCNRFFPDEYKYGNIYDYSNLESAFNSNGFRKILTDAIERREKCKDCDIYTYCEGGCNNNAICENGIKNNGGKSCLALKEMYKYIWNSIQKILLENNDEHLNPWLKKVMKKYRSSYTS